MTTLTKLPRPMDAYLNWLDNIAAIYRDTPDEEDEDNSPRREEGDIIAGLAEWLRGGASGALPRPYPVYHDLLLRQIGDDIVVANHRSTGEEEEQSFLDSAELLAEFVNWMLERPFDR